MTVKNISKYHQLSIEELNKLGTRELVHVLESSRGHIICSCGKGNHCGDETLTQDEKLWNEQQKALYTNLKEILNTREDLGSTKPIQKLQKKKMQY